MKKNKNLILYLGILSLFFTINSVFAVEDTTNQDDIKNTINKNIVSPNETPGLMIDTQKAKRYYDSLEDAHRTEFNIFKEKSPIPYDSIIKMPKRLNTDAPTTKVKEVIIDKSEIFDDLEIAKFKSLIEGQDVTAEDLNNFIDVINQQYARKKVITARASLESFENGILKVELMEAKVGEIIVEGNRFNRKWFLKKMISAKPDKVLNLSVLENDLRRFNKNARSIELSAQLKPGKEYGTTDIVLKAKEQFPFHFSASWDSFGRETTGLLRGGLMASADSVLGFQDRLTFAINMAKASTSPYVDYNIPINRRGTRIGGSYMYGTNKVISGEYEDFDLTAKTHNISVYVNHPIIDTPRGNLYWNTSGNIKLTSSEIFDFEYSKYKDLNISTGLSGRLNFNKSVLFGSVYSTNGVIKDEIQSESNFFTKLTADAYYIHYLPKGIVGILRAGGQYSPYDVPYVEQYQIGGMSSVRGYSESLLLAANSYFASIEFLFPIPFLPEEIKIPFRKDNATYRLRDSIKFATFFDTGAIFPYNAGPVNTTNFISSAGAGLRIAISKYLTGRIYFGVPVMNTKYYSQSNCRLHFDLVASPF